MKTAEGRRRRLPHQDQYVLPSAKERMDSLHLLSRWRRASVIFWGKLAHHSEARWLEACGWTKVRNGWLLPEWHPHKIRAVRAQAKQMNFASRTVGQRFETQRFDRPQDEFRGISPLLIREPYDQNHAANSQRYHLTVTQRPPPSIHTMLPKYPAYVRWFPYQLAVFACTMTAFICSTATKSNLHLLFCVAGTISALVGFALARKVQKDLELDHVEIKMRGK